MDIEYWFEMPNKWTFKQEKLREFILKYIPDNSKVLIPFAGEYRFNKTKKCTFIYNDLNPEIKADYNMSAWKLKDIYDPESFDVIIADPPYSDYIAVGWYDGFHCQEITIFRKTAYYLLKDNGIYIELGFNSSGLKKKYANKIALGICCLGGSHNDILILVQQKIERKELTKDIEDIYIIKQSKRKRKYKKVWDYFN